MSDDLAARIVEAAARGFVDAEAAGWRALLSGHRGLAVGGPERSMRAALAAAVREASPPDKPTLRYAAMHLDRAANAVDGGGFQSNAADLRRTAALLRALADLANGQAENEEA